MNDESFQQAKDYALSQLKQKLPPALTYHNYSHTTDEVLPAAIELAKLSGLSGRETCLLEIAAVYHDLGYSDNPKEHERIGAEIAGNVLPQFGFDPQDIEMIQNMILATKLSARPQTLLEQVLVDADLSILGSQDFYKRSIDLRKELAASGQDYSDLEWCQVQLKFLERHSYVTEAAREIFTDTKNKNIARLRRLLAQARELEECE
ncbi:MAG: HD domain-containing protein [Anaerolineales bacterium]|jgi:adenylate cyclase